jgi:hypothetical protein
MAGRAMGVRGGGGGPQRIRTRELTRMKNSSSVTAAVVIQYTFPESPKSRLDHLDEEG